MCSNYHEDVYKFLWSLELAPAELDGSILAGGRYGMRVGTEGSVGTGSVSCLTVAIVIKHGENNGNVKQIAPLINSGSNSDSDLYKHVPLKINNKLVNLTLSAWTPDVNRPCISHSDQRFLFISRMTPHSYVHTPRTDYSCLTDYWERSTGLPIDPGQRQHIQQWKSRNHLRNKSLLSSRLGSLATGRSVLAITRATIVVRRTVWVGVVITTVAVDHVSTWGTSIVNNSHTCWSSGSHGFRCRMIHECSSGCPASWRRHWSRSELQRWEDDSLESWYHYQCKCNRSSWSFSECRWLYWFAKKDDLTHKNGVFRLYRVTWCVTSRVDSCLAKVRLLHCSKGKISRRTFFPTRHSCLSTALQAPESHSTSVGP